MPDQSELFSLTASAGSILDVLKQIVESMRQVQTAVAEVGKAMQGMSTASGQAEAAARGVAGSAEQASSAESNLAEATQRASSSAKEHGFSLLDLTSKLSMTYYGVQQLVQGVIGLGQALIMPNATLEQTRVALTTMLGSESAAVTEMNHLKMMAAQTPFEFTDLADATQHLLAFGFQLKDTDGILTSVGDALSSLGKLTPAYLEQVVNVFGQIHASGHVMKQDLNQLSSIGINGLAILAQQMGKTQDQVMELISKGLIPSDDAIRMLTQGIEQNPLYKGGMAKQSQTFLGVLSTVKDMATQFLQALTGPLFLLAERGLNDLANLMQSKAFQDFIDLLGKRMAEAFGKIGDLLKTIVVPAFQGLGNVIGPLMGPLGNVAGALGHLAAAAGGGLVQALHDIGVGFQTMTGQGGAAQPLIAGLASAIQGVADGINNVVDGATKGTGPLAGLHDLVMPLVDVFHALGDIIRNVVEWFVPVPDSIQRVGPVLEVVKGHASGFQQLMQTLGQVLSPFVGVFQALWGAVVQFGGGFAWMLQQLNSGQSGPGIFRMIWETVSGMLGPAFQRLGAAIMNDLVPSFQQLFQALQPIMPILGAFISMIVQTDFSILAVEVGSILTYIVNTITWGIKGFAAMIRTIAGFLNLLVDIFTGNWGRIEADTKQINQGIIDLIAAIWNGGIGNLLDLIGNFGNGVVQIFEELFDKLVGHSIVPEGVTAIGGWFGKLPGMLGGALAGMVPMALDFGEKILAAFIGGLEAKIPALMTTMSKIAADVSGPLIALGGHAFGWGADVLAQFIDGLNSGAAAKLGHALQTWWDNMALGFVLIVGGAYNNAVKTVGQFIAGLIGGAKQIAKQVLLWATIFHDNLDRLAQNALSWGEHLIENLIQGIRNKLAQLANVVSQVANTISSHLHFSVPEQGPLAKVPEWMPDFVDLLVEGMRAGQGKLAAAAQQMMSGVTPGAVLGGLTGARAGSSPTLSTSRIEALLQQLVTQGARPLGASPVSATTGAVYQHYNQSFNLADPSTYFALMDMLAGLRNEYAARGAING